MGAWRTTPSTATYDAAYDPAGEVVEICRDLIRIDTTQLRRRVRAGGAEGRRARRGAARRGRHRAASCSSRTPGRTSLVAQLGRTPGGEDALLLHGHLDVVPAAADDWQVDPFSGEIQDGYLWGRGAVDMKDFDAMLLSVVRARARAGAVPERPIVLCFTADEEAGGHQGAAACSSRTTASSSSDCTEAVGEVGGFSTTVRGQRLYLIEAAEKGMAWMRLTATRPRRPRLDDATPTTR